MIIICFLILSRNIIERRKFVNKYDTVSFSYAMIHTYLYAYRCWCKKSIHKTYLLCYKTKVKYTSFYLLKYLYFNKIQWRNHFFVRLHEKKGHFITQLQIHEILVFIKIFSVIVLHAISIM